MDLPLNHGFCWVGLSTMFGSHFLSQVIGSTNASQVVTLAVGPATTPAAYATTILVHNALSILYNQYIIIIIITYKIYANILYEFTRVRFT